ncbi:MAG: PTS sugar transporter subunit IIA [bacterium]|nr:PTS sugar transporter subunit IIA [bacterium]
MDSILDALQEGRLLELPDNDKERSLQLLAHLIEAIPSLPAGTDVAGLILAREKTANTSVGMGWACPHARIPSEGDLTCAIGWSPMGIDYGAPGEPPVRIVVMYLVPDNQKNHYLKEVSTLVKALRSDSGFQHLESATDLNMVRHRLLDLVGAAKEIAGPDARARMIQLETLVSAPTARGVGLAGMLIEPLSIIAGPAIKPVVLTQNRELHALLLGAHPGLAEALGQQGSQESGPWRILKRAATPFQGDLVLYDCLAVRPA